MISTQTRNEVASQYSVRTILLTGLLIGVAVGVVVYAITIRTFSSLKSVEGPSSPTTESAHSKSTKNEIDRVFSIELTEPNLLKLTEYLSTLNQRNLKDLIEKSSKHSWNPRLYTIQEILVEFLVQISPEEAVASLAGFTDHKRHAFLRVVFAHWSTTNLERALSAALALPRTDQRLILDTIFREHNSLSSEDLSLLSSRLNFESEFVEWQREVDTYEILDEEPARAFDFLTNDEIDDIQQVDLYRQTVNEWFKLEGLNIIPQIGNADLRGGLWGELFDYVTGKDRPAALDFLIGDDEQISRPGLVSHLLDRWGEDDPKEAFRAVQDLPKSQFRNSVSRSLIFDWGQRDPNAVLERLMEIPRMHRSDAVSAAAAALANVNPEDALERVLSFSSVPGTNVDVAIQSVVRIWATDEPTRALEWIQINAKVGSTSRKTLIRSVIGKYALVEPTKAMTIAVEEFKSDQSGDRLDSYVIRSLLSADRINTAIELLQQVQNDSRTLETVNVGVELAKKNRMDEVWHLASPFLPRRNRTISIG